MVMKQEIQIIREQQDAQKSEPAQDAIHRVPTPRTSLFSDEALGAAFETCLIIGGLLAMLVLLPHGIFGDGAERFQAISDLLERGKLSNMQYSIVGPAFSIPFWLLGKFSMTPEWWLARYNLILFSASLLIMYLLLKERAHRGLLRKFFLLLIIASMFANQLSAYYGEVFTALCVAIGVIMLVSGRAIRGWGMVVLGVVNTPATVVSLISMSLLRIFKNRRLRYILVVAAALAFIVIEYTIRRGSIFVSYEPPPNPALHTVMPYSGLRGFSYPFFFGLLSILFSFGKGLIFFVPGLLLPVRGLLHKAAPDLKLDIYGIYLLWVAFVVGLILVYSPWWAWYGGWFWGPRFFLFACIPASFAIALRLHYRGAARTDQAGGRDLSRPYTLLGDLLTLGVLLLSVWVGINGAVFDQQGLSVCVTKSYALELLCHYTPEFSVLWHPFVVNEFAALNSRQLLYIAYCLFVFVYLVTPLMVDILQQTSEIVRVARKMYLNAGAWRF